MSTFMITTKGHGNLEVWTEDLLDKIEEMEFRPSRDYLMSWNICHAEQSVDALFFLIWLIPINEILT